MTAVHGDHLESQLHSLSPRTPDIVEVALEYSGLGLDEGDVVSNVGSVERRIDDRGSAHDLPAHFERRRHDRIQRRIVSQGKWQRTGRCLVSTRQLEHGWSAEALADRPIDRRSLAQIEAYTSPGDSSG